MAYALLDSNKNILDVVDQLTPFMEESLRDTIVDYNPPAIDKTVSKVVATEPVVGPAVEFTIVPLPLEEQKAAKTAVVKNLLDETARAHKYDNIISAVSYAASTHPVYGPEGRAFLEWRDACWDKTFEVFDGITESNPMPATADFLAMLPPLGL